MVRRVDTFGSQRRMMRGIGLVCGIALVILAFLPQVTDIVARGRATTEQSYIFVVPLVAAYLMLIRSSRLRCNRSIQGSSSGLLIVLASLAFSKFGHDRDILVLWQSAPIVALIGLAVAYLGLQRTVAIAPGIVVLFATLPVPGTIRQLIAQPLQGFATGVTSFVLDFAGVAAVRVGNFIEINGIPVAVGEACNGMRLVMPLALVIYAFVFSLPLRLATRASLIVLSLPVALACNVLRLIPTALAYGYLPAMAVEVHDFLGWLMIPAALAIMLGILRFLEWLDLPLARLRLALA